MAAPSRSPPASDDAPTSAVPAHDTHAHTTTSPPAPPPSSPPPVPAAAFDWAGTGFATPHRLGPFYVDTSQRLTGLDGPSALVYPLPAPPPPPPAAWQQQQPYAGGTSPTDYGGGGDGYYEPAQPAKGAGRGGMAYRAAHAHGHTTAPAELDVMAHLDATYIADGAGGDLGDPVGGDPAARSTLPAPLSPLALHGTAALLTPLSGPAVPPPPPPPPLGPQRANSAPHFERLPARGAESMIPPLLSQQQRDDALFKAWTTSDPQFATLPALHQLDSLPVPNLSAGTPTDTPAHYRPAVVPTQRAGARLTRPRRLSAAPPIITHGLADAPYRLPPAPLSASPVNWSDFATVASTQHSPRPLEASGVTSPTGAGGAAAALWGASLFPRVPPLGAPAVDASPGVGAHLPRRRRVDHVASPAGTDNPPAALAAATGTVPPASLHPPSLHWPAPPLLASVFGGDVDDEHGAGEASAAGGAGAAAGGSSANDEAERPHQCHVPTCRRRFKRRAHLLRHLETHLPRNPQFQCEVCGMPFSRSDNLRSHERRAHGIHRPRANELAQGGGTGTPPRPPTA